MKGIRITLTLAALALVAGPVTEAPAQELHYPGIPWSDLLPPVASPAARAETVPGCRRPGLRCVTRALRRLREERDRYGCDHRAVFATTYMTLTRVFKRMLKRDPDLVQFKRYAYIEDMLFARFYFRVLRAWERDDPVPEAWRIAFTAAESGDYYGAQDMLLGINAHVQNDMPFVIASLGVRTRKGVSRKPDHDAINAVLAEAYEPVVRAVRKRYDPSLDLTNPSQVPIDDAAGLEMVRGWREMVWRNAERLANASTASERADVARSIEAYAGVAAQLIAAAPAPGYGATRDAYCQAQIGG